MNYSFHCKNCGYTSMSNDKREVANARKKHYVEVAHIVGRPMKICPLAGTNKNNQALVARPDLAIKIQNLEVM